MNKKIFTILFLALVFLPTQSFAGIVSVEVASVSSAEVLGNGYSVSLGMSPDGRYVLFTSEADNMVAGDTNVLGDVFLRDRTLGTTTRVSVGDGEEEGDGGSVLGNVTSDGRYVVFLSEATNLVAGDTNGVDDIFMRDTLLGSTTRMNINSSDEEANATSYAPFITPDGSYIVFSSEATNLVAGDTNASIDVFVINVSTGDIERISVSSAEVEGNSGSGDVGFVYISEDARYVVFDSNASNLVANDTNMVYDIFVRDRISGTTERISVSSAEVEANGDSTYPFISSDGRYISFLSDSTNLVSGDTNGVTDVFVRDTLLGTTTRYSVSSAGVQGNGASSFPYVSDDGRFVAFGSESTNLVADDTNGDIDSFLHDTLSGVTQRISLTDDGLEANGSVSSLSIGVLSGNAQYVILTSGHTDIVSGDSNANFDVFLYELDDDDGITAAVEQAAPNSGDVDENGFIDSVEQNVSSFVNAVSGNYATVETTGECVRNDSPSAVAESSLATQDSGYDYPLGIIDFSIDCTTAGETATISLYCFCENTPVSGLVARKYDENTGLYTTIDSAVISEVTIGGSRALKMVYDVTDGGDLDEDGLSNGTIIDPVGFATATASLGGSSGSRPSRRLAVNSTPTLTTPSMPEVCYVFTTLIKSGSRYGEVSKLQEFLNKKGFNSGVVDGLFGPMTDRAVRNFQLSNGLVSDGIVGPITRGVLNKCN